MRDMAPRKIRQIRAGALWRAVTQRRSAAGNAHFECERASALRDNRAAHVVAPRFEFESLCRTPAV